MLVQSLLAVTARSIVRVFMMLPVSNVRTGTSFLLSPCMPGSQSTVFLYWITKRDVWRVFNLVLGPLGFALLLFVHTHASMLVPQKVLRV
jgi:hypothetical protein